MQLQRDLYLQLIKTYVTLGNDLKFRPQGREASNLNYRAAREQVVECLSNLALRDTRPEPVTEYPPEMLRLFADVRAERFGAFRVARLEPATAVVLMDGDTLGHTPDFVRGDANLPVGTHRVVVMAPHHRTWSEIVNVSAGATLERDYALTRSRGARWYVTRGAVLAGTAVGVGLLLGHGSPGTTGASPLPVAPPPPSR